MRKTTNKKVWLTRKELFRFLDCVIWIFTAKALKKDLKVLIKRIDILWEKSGSNFTFLYLKEVFRLLIRFLSGSPETTDCIKPNTILVKRDSSGLPTLIPLSLRELIRKKRESKVQMLLTLLSVFRVMPSVQKPKFSTITAPFTGTSEVLDDGELKLAIRDLGVRLRIKDHSLIKLESAGPHGRKSAWCSNADLVALVQHPKTFNSWKRVMRLSWTGYLIMLWVTVLGWIARPFALVNDKLTLGRTAVVLDQAGKGRLVAITNYWIQLALKPLHKSVFAFLHTISDLDGTFDQSKPLDILLQKDDWVNKFSCFDLSAATDRLPVKLQAQILNSLQENLGNLWLDLLDIEWVYKNYKFKYTVGQPMGAYSSW